MAYPGPDGERTVMVTVPDGEVAEYRVRREGDVLTATGPADHPFSLRDTASGREAAAEGGTATLR